MCINFYRANICLTGKNKKVAWPNLNMRSTAAWLGLASVGLAVSTSEHFNGETAALSIGLVWFPFMFWWMLALQMKFPNDRVLGILQGIQVAFATMMLVVLGVAMVLVFKTWSYKLRIVVAAAPGAVFLWSWQQQPLDWISVRGLVAIITVVQVAGGAAYGFVNDINQSFQSTVLNFLFAWVVVGVVHSMNNDLLKEKKVEPGDGEGGDKKGD